MKRLVVVLIALLGLTLSPASAFAAWAPGGNGSGYGSGLSIGLPTSKLAAATGPTSIHITWAAPSAPSATPTQYVVRRTAPTTTTACTVSGSTFACDDTGLSSLTSYTYTIEATVGTNWSSGQTTGFLATTSALPNFIVSVTGGNKTAGSAFTATIKATTNGVTTDTSYSGSKTVTFSGPASSDSGQAPLYPASVTFASGVGTASIKLYDATTAILTATQGILTGATSVPVVAAIASQLQYTSSNESCASGSANVGNGGTFTSKVTMYDAYLNPATEATTRTVNMTMTTGAVSP
ncbi:MAG: fibronectin type III domain-containing protein, partial [Acidimicrobiia bacterium]